MNFNITTIIPIIIFIAFCYLTYILLTKKRANALDYISPLNLFVLMAFIGYPLKFVITYYFPQYFFFNNFNVQFSIAESDYYNTLLVFVLGYAAFVFAYKTVLFKTKTPLDVKPVNPNRNKFKVNGILLLALALLMIFADFYFKQVFSVGLLLVKPKIMFSGYIYFFLMFGKIFILSLYTYNSFTGRSRFHQLASIVLLFVMGITDAINMSKSGFVNVFIILISSYFMISQNKKIPPLAIKRILIFVPIVIVLLFPLVELYRFDFMILGKGDINLMNLIGTFSNLNMSGLNFLSMGVERVINRVIGFGELFPLVAYAKEHALFNYSDYFNGNTEVISATLYKDILGMSNSPGGFAAGLWAYLYSYFGPLGVFITFFIWGKLSRFLFNKLKYVSAKHPNLGVGIFPAYLIWFYFVTFEGQVGAYGVKYIVALIFISLFWFILFEILSNEKIFKKHENRD